MVKRRLRIDVLQEDPFTMQLVWVLERHSVWQSPGLGLQTGRHVAAVSCDRWVGAQQAPQQCGAAAVLPSHMYE